MNDFSLATVSNETLFEEVACRLQKLTRAKTGKDLLFGEVAFVFHNGRFQLVEERSRHRIFRADLGDQRDRRKCVSP